MMAVGNLSGFLGSWSSILWTLLVAYTIFVACVVIYRLLLDPIAQFPGPKLAATTSLYEAYFQCIKDGGGRYFIEINKMHDRYGMTAHSGSPLTFKFSSLTHS